MEVKGIIFDLDGVIVSTDQYHYMAWKQIADSLGIFFNKEINNRLRGVSRMDSLDIILENYKGDKPSEERKREIAEQKNEIYRQLLKEMGPDDVSKDVRMTLTRLRKQGIRLAIGSSSKNTKFILAQAKLIDAFDAVSDGTNIKKSKPDPEVFIKGAEFLGVCPAECIVVEDAVAGIEAAIAGGFTAVAIGDAVKCKKADYNIVKLGDLINVIEQID